MSDRRLRGGLSGRLVLCLVAAVGFLAAASKPTSAPYDPSKRPPIISPDVALTFDTGRMSGPGQQVVLTAPKWTILLDFHSEIITDTDGPRVRKLFRRPAAGGAAEEIWDDSHAGPRKPAENQEIPQVWIVYDDGTVLFSRNTELTYVAKPGARHSWVAKVKDEECLPFYADASNMLRPRDFERSREAWYVPGERDAFDLDQRIKITGDDGIRYFQPLVKRHGNRFAWVDWPSYAEPGATKYRLGGFDFETKQNWGADLDIRGKVSFEKFDGRLVQITGKRYDAVTGAPK